MIAIARETSATFKQDAIPLFEADWKETNPHAAEINLEVDYTSYKALEDAGRLYIFGARDNGKLCGYIIFASAISNHHKKKVAVCSGLFVDKTNRGRGLAVNLISCSTAALGQEGIEQVKISTGPMHDIGPLLEKFGFLKEEVVYSKMLTS